MLGRAILSWLDDWATRGYVATDETLTVRYWNAWMSSSSGVERSDAIGLPIHGLIRGPSRSQALAAYEAALDGRPTVLSQRLHSYVFPMPAPATSPFAQMQQTVRISPLFDAGRVVGTMTVVDDVTDRVLIENQLRGVNEDLERRVATRTAELLATNRELETFSYTVAHDLRSPVRVIRSYAQILAGRLEGLGPLERHQLARIEEAAGRMTRLIDALLELGSLSRRSLNPAVVDLTAIARAVIENLRALEPGRRVEANVAEGLTAMGDPALVEQVMHNLIENAWKFSSRRDLAVIEVGRDARAGAFFVRDNGAGFDVEHLDQAFAPFRRLHRAEEFPGTGVGLTTVRRILDLHGGTIWAESSPDAGATFYFTIPA